MIIPGPEAASATGSGLRYRTRPIATVRGTLTVPGDKSISHRALLLSGIASGQSRISGLLESEDCRATLQAMRLLGVKVAHPQPQVFEVAGAGLQGLNESPTPLDMGNSGTAMRLFAGLLAAQRFDSVLIGDSSLMKRPMERVAAPLRAMGAVIETESGHAPLRISGGQRLHPVSHDLPIASAQVKSAILLAGLYVRGETSVTEPAVTRDHSERMLRAFGAKLEVEGRRVRIAGPAQLHGCAIEVPGDFSSAAFFIVAASLAAEGVVTIRNVGINPTRTGLLEILRQMGAEVRVINERSSDTEPVADLEIERRELRGVAVPRALVSLAIDEFPVLFIAAACARGDTIITGAEELRVKESDRIAVMATGLNALGIQAEVMSDGMRIRGGRLTGGLVDSRGDHRIAMAFAIASAQASGPIEIADVANVATSFPGFVATARSIGFDIDSVGGI